MDRIYAASFGAATAIDYMFSICSYSTCPESPMNTLALHIEVALAIAPPSLLDADGPRRHAAIGEIAQQLVERLRCFDIRSNEMPTRGEAQPCLFHDMGPIGL